VNKLLGAAIEKMTQLMEEGEGNLYKAT